MLKDIGTVRNDLELNIDWIKNIPSHQFPGWMNVVNSMEDAIELLKAPVEPEIHMGDISIKHDNPELIVYCGACKGQMVCKYEEYPIDYMRTQYKFCHHCGTPVKWN